MAIIMIGIPKIIVRKLFIAVPFFLRLSNVNVTRRELFHRFLPGGRQLSFSTKTVCVG